MHGARERIRLYNNHRTLFAARVLQTVCNHNANKNTNTGRCEGIFKTDSTIMFAFAFRRV